MRSVKIRVFALLLCLMTLFSLLPCGEAFAAEGEEEEVLILAASDFQIDRVVVAEQRAKVKQLPLLEHLAVIKAGVARRNQIVLHLREPLFQMLFMSHSHTLTSLRFTDLYKRRRR